MTVLITLGFFGIRWHIGEGDVGLCRWLRECLVRPCMIHAPCLADSMQLF